MADRRAFERALEKGAAGERLSPEEGLSLFEGKDLVALGAAADAVRERKHPEGYATYVIDRNVNYTNVCATYCSFCAFYRPPGHEEGYVNSREVLARKIAETRAAGGNQILLQGGHNPHLRLGWYLELFRWVKESFPGLHLHALSPAEVHFIGELEGMSHREVVARLREAGLDSIPGGGAEILVERVRRRVSRLKCSAEDWLSVMREAHGLGIRTTATMMFGHVETPAERVEHLERLRQLQDQTGGFTAFICWTYQNDGSAALEVPLAGAAEYLKTLAVARLYLDNFANLQSSWVTQGPKIGEISLHFGANDMGSTMIEENVVSAAGTVYCMREADLIRMAENAGFVPRRRDFYYNLLN